MNYPLPQNTYLKEKTDKQIDAPKVLYALAANNIKDGNLKSALEKCRESRALLRDRLTQPESCKLFLDVTLLMCHLFHILREGYQEWLENQKEAEALALRMGDQRRLAMLYLQSGRVKMHILMLNESVKDSKKGLAMVDDLGDDDMVSRSSAFRAFYFFVQGLCRETIVDAEKAMSMFANPHLFDSTICCSLAMSLAFTGHMPQAIGVLDSNMKLELSQKWGQWSMISLKAFMGQVFLMCGKLKEGLAYLQESMQAAEASNDNMGLFWSRRALSYYHFLEGRFKESYETLAHCMQCSSASGFPRLFYGMPWFLEMLNCFHKMGFKPIPGCEYMAEMERALNGPNVLLKGVALRLRAMEDWSHGGDIKKVKTMFLDSELELERSGATYELAKTRTQLALLELSINSRKAAKLPAMKAWHNWPCDKNTLFPEKLRALIDSECVQPFSQSRQVNLLKRYSDFTERLLVPQNMEEIQPILLNATCKFFEVERGAIFSIDTESKKILFLTGYNLTALQAQGKNFKTNSAVIQKTYEAQKPIVTRFYETASETSLGQVYCALCLPVRIGEMNTVLYHDVRFISGSFDIFDDFTLDHFAKHLENIIAQLIQYQVHTEKRSSDTINAVTTNNSNIKKHIMDLKYCSDQLSPKFDQIAKSDATLLIRGETGVGKGVLARKIHEMSMRSEGPFVAIDLSSVPEGLVESEIFGHEKGSFTGADRQKQGLMELANKGTLFIDEVGEIPKAVQVKVLRAIEEKSFIRVGGVLKKSSDFRLIVATNRDLVKEVEIGNFREDLYYRLCVIPLTVPPLREHIEDVIELADRFLADYEKKYNRPVPGLSDRDKQLLKSYSWPGNIRELKNVIERSVILSGPDKLVLTMTRSPKTFAYEDQLEHDILAGRPTLDELQRRYINKVLEETNGKLAGPSGAAAILGMKRTTLQHRMKKLQLQN